MSRIKVFCQSNQGWHDRYTIEIQTGLCSRQVKRHLARLIASGQVEAREDDRGVKEYRWLH